MKINDAGLSLIKQFEGIKLKAYKDQGGILTIGYGHTGGYIHEGMVITQNEADELLKQDLEGFESDVLKDVTVKLTDNQFSALVSLCYNIGPQNFKTSTLCRLLNTSNFKDAADQFVRWDRVAGEVNKGLLRRRLAERALFIT